MNEIIEVVTNQGFAIAVAVYLLYERTKFNIKITEIMERISITISSIEQEMRSDQ